MAEPLEILVSATPNPHAVKLTLNRVVATQGQTYRDAATAQAPWAKALLGIPGVVGVFGVNNFISINKQSNASWEQIVPEAEQALRRVFAESTST